MHVVRCNKIKINSRITLLVVKVFEHTHFFRILFVSLWNWYCNRFSATYFWWFYFILFSFIGEIYPFLMCFCVCACVQNIDYGCENEDEKDAIWLYGIVSFSFIGIIRLSIGWGLCDLPLTLRVIERANSDPIFEWWMMWLKEITSSSSIGWRYLVQFY